MHSINGIYFNNVNITMASIMASVYIQLLQNLRNYILIDAD